MSDPTIIETMTQYTGEAGGAVGMLSMGYVWLRSRFAAEDKEQAALKEEVSALRAVCDAQKTRLDDEIRRLDAIEVKTAGHAVDLNILKAINTNLADLRSAMLVLAAASGAQTKEAVQGILNQASGGAA